MIAAVALLCSGIMPIMSPSWAKVLAIRSGVHPDMTRVVVDLTESVRYALLYEDNPHQVKILLENQALAGEAGELAKDFEAVGVLKGIRVGRHGDNMEITFPLRHPATVSRSFALRPDQNRPYRFVFDLKPVSEAEWNRRMLAQQADQKSQEAPPGKTGEIPPKPASWDKKEAAGATSELSALEDTPSLDDRSSGETQTVMPNYDAAVYDDTVYDDDYDGLSFSGYVESEGRLFTQSAGFPGQDDGTLSFAAEPRLEYVSESGDHIFIANLFGRVDLADEERSHFDVREFKWLGVFGPLTVTAGINTVFWGVTESNHLVDILNQDDMLEDVDQKDKLGQPMVSLSYMTDFGTFSAYFMTYFRERRFPGRDGRLRFALPVDEERAIYEAEAEEWHLDWALRWSRVVGDFDIGLYHFHGTGRDPSFVMGVDGNGQPVLIPRYDLIDQTGVDVQATRGGFLWKLEAIYQSGNEGSPWGDDFFALAGGVEYTLYGAFGGDSDLGLLAEYSYDDRGELAPSLLEDDIFVGLRWTANDVDSTELLFGALLDLDSSAKFINLEGSRRLGDYWKISLDARFFLNVPMTDPLFPISRDDFLQLRVARYF